MILIHINWTKNPKKSTSLQRRKRDQIDLDLESAVYSLILNQLYTSWTWVGCILIYNEERKSRSTSCSNFCCGDWEYPYEWMAQSNLNRECDIMYLNFVLFILTFVLGIFSLRNNHTRSFFSSIYWFYRFEFSTLYFYLCVRSIY